MFNWLRDLPQDLRYATRLLRKSPGFAVTAVLTLALGIGANTAVFSIINGALLRPLLYREPARLVAVWDHSIRESGLAKIFASYNDFVEFQRSRSFEDLAVATWANGATPIMTGRGPARSVLAIPVSVKFFDLLGVAPALGRTFGSNDLRHGCAVVLSNSFWRSSFGSEPKIVGQTINLDQRSCTILGVMPPGFSFYPAAAAVWSLITLDFVPPPEKLFVGIFGRLKPGISVQAAQAELITLHSGLHRADGQERDIAPTVYGLQGEFTWLAGRNLRVTLWLLLGAVAIVLLIACFNVANMLLGQSFGRALELAVRAALGGGRTRLLRQLLTEGLLLSLLGGALGIAGAVGALSYFRAVNPVEMPIGAEVGISWPVLFFTFAVACITSLIFGFAPAWRASAASLSDTLKRGGRGLLAGYGRSHLARVLVAGEVVLSVVLLVGAALLIKSVARMGSTPLGFQPDRVLAAGLSLPVRRYSDPAEQLRLYDDLESRITALPGVQDTALASTLPPYSNASQAIEIFGSPTPQATARHDVDYVRITPGYFRTLGVNLLRGRSFTDHDRSNTEPVAIIDAALAGEYFPNADAIGQRLRIQEEGRSQEWATVVGVVATERRTTVYQEMNWTEPATLFRPLAQDTGRSVYLVIRTNANAVPLGTAVRRELAEVDSEIAVGGLEALRHKIIVFLAYPRFRAVLLGAFGVLALLLAAIGLHGVLAQFVAQRVHEMGVRLALGARSRDVMRLVIRQGGIPVMLGLVIGIASALALGKVLGGLLYGVQARDPITLAAVCITLLLTAMIAIWLPTRRAARVDPMGALRQE